MVCCVPLIISFSRLILAVIAHDTLLTLLLGEDAIELFTFGSLIRLFCKLFDSLIKLLCTKLFVSMLMHGFLSQHHQDPFLFGITNGSPMALW